MLAAYNGHAEVVQLLLDHGADPNRLNDRQQVPTNPPTPTRACTSVSPDLLERMS